MFEERIAAMNQRTEESIVASAGQFDKRTYTVDEIQDILGISRTSAYKECKKRSYYDTGYTARYGDKLITLSTCEYSHKNGRMVVVGCKINEYNLE